LVRTGILAQIASGYLGVLRVAAFLVAVVAGAAAAGALIALPLWLFATQATTVYNWFVVAGVGACVLAVVVARVLRGARTAPSVAGYLRAAVGRAARGTARSLAVALLAVAALLVFARWGTWAGLAAIPVLAVLAGAALFVPHTRSQTGADAGLWSAGNERSNDNN
jgi:hypothetical protein